MFRKKFSLVLAKINGINYHSNTGMYDVYHLDIYFGINNFRNKYQILIAKEDKNTLLKLNDFYRKDEKFYMLFLRRKWVGFSTISHPFEQILLPGKSDQIINEFLGVK